MFIHDQLYVAISRVKRMKGLKIIIFDKDGNLFRKITIVVFKEVFRNLMSINGLVLFVYVST